MIFHCGMNTDIKKYKKNFCFAVKSWFNNKYNPVKRGDVTAAAEYLKISQPLMSLILSGDKWCGEETKRREIAQKIGIPYEEMIGLETKRNDQKTYQTEVVCPSEHNAKSVEEMMLEFMKLPPKKRGVEIVMLAAAENMIMDIKVSHGDRDRSDKVFGPLKRYWDGEITEQELYKESYNIFNIIREKSEKLLKEHGLK